MGRRRIVVLGTLASSPFAGMAWMHMQILVGLRRLGCDAYYFEITCAWPFDPVRNSRVCDSDYALPYLARVADRFGVGDRWAYRRSYSDRQWFGMARSQAEDLLANADAVLNITGATRFEYEGLDVGRPVYFGTDPVYHEVSFANGCEDGLVVVREHQDFVTYGENIGTAVCPIPSLPGLRAVTRQPVLLDFWESGPPARPEYTTVANWRQTGRDVVWQGETYHWSKDREFLKVIDLPRRTRARLELALTNESGGPATHGHGEAVPAYAAGQDVRSLLESNGWRLADALALTLDPWPYREYVRASRGEFTVAKQGYANSGWFSERSACYLAAGRPVVTQDTGFGAVLPTGEGLFAFHTADEAAAALEAIESDYPRHSRAARAIAEEYFRAETVLAKLLGSLGV